MGLFDAIASSINTGANIFFQNKTNRENIQNQWDMWNATNEYNSPEAQMERYKDAGLNPNLIYGQQNTTQPMNVGLANPPQSNLQGFGTLGDYVNLLMAKEKLTEQELNNEILRDTLTARKNSYIYGNAKTLSEINKAYSDINVNNANIEKVNSDIERNGFLNALSDLDAKIKAFEIEDFDRVRKIRQNELEKSNNSVESSKLLVTNQELQNQLLSTNITIAEFSLQLDYMEYVLKNAQTDEVLSRIGLNETEKQRKLQEITNMQKQLEVMSSQIDLNQSNIDTNHVKRQQMRSDIASDWFKNIFGNKGLIGSVKDGLSTFKLMKFILK